VQNPLRSEDAMFRFLVRVGLVALAVVVIVVVVRAIS
jgi:hypothetical protein